MTHAATVRTAGCLRVGSRFRPLVFVVDSRNACKVYWRSHPENLALLAVTEAEQAIATGAYAGWRHNRPDLRRNALREPRP